MADKTGLKELLSSLNRAIEEDRKLFVAAEVDPALDVVRDHVNELLDKLGRDAKSKAEKALQSAQLAVNEMEEWGFQETSKSDYNAALKTIKKANDNLRTGSYFGYLDALQLAKEAQGRAEKATNLQKTCMKEKIDKLNDQVSKFFGKTGDFEVFEVKQYAPDKLEIIENLRREGQKHSKIQSYVSYIQAQASLKECLKVGYSAIEKSIQPLENRELLRLNLATVLILPFWPLWILSLTSLATLWPLWLVSWILVGISWSMWYGGFTRLTVKTPFDYSSLLWTFIAPIIFFFCLSYFNDKRELKNKYEKFRKELQDKCLIASYED